MTRVTAAVAPNYATGTSHDDASRRQPATGLEERASLRIDDGRATPELDPAPDPNWDKVTQASWESFPASDAPGWR